MGVVISGLSEACRQELNAGLVLHKTTIVMAGPHFAPQLQPYFASDLVIIDPAHPDLAELGIVQHLKAVDAEHGAEKALLALSTLALGLLILLPPSKAILDACAEMYYLSTVPV